MDMEEVLIKEEMGKEESDRWEAKKGLPEEDMAQLKIEDEQELSKESKSGTVDGGEASEEVFTLDVATAQEFLDCWFRIKTLLETHPNNEKAEYHTYLFEENIVSFYRGFLYKNTIGTPDKVVKKPKTATIPESSGDPNDLNPESSDVDVGATSN